MICGQTPGLEQVSHRLQRVAREAVQFRRAGQLLDQIVLHLRDDAAKVGAQLEAKRRALQDDLPQLPIRQLPVFQLGDSLGAHIIGQGTEKAVLAQYAARA